MCLLKQFGMNIEDWLKMYFCKNVNLPSTILDSDTNKEGHYNLSSLVARTSFTTTRLLHNVVNSGLVISKIVALITK